MGIGLSNVASAMMVRLLQQERIAHNLANANTPGYRAVRLSLRNFGELFLWHVSGPGNRPPARLPLGTTVGMERLNLHPGPFRPTGNPLDVAIDGQGWFVVQTPQGLRYTRKGKFTLRPRGDGTSFLVTTDGYLVLGAEGQPLQLPPSPDRVDITEKGEIFVRGKRVGQFRIVRFLSPDDLLPAGGSYYIGTNPRPDTESRLRQGVLEGSNVRPVVELVRMVHALRLYELAAKALQTGETMERALREATQA